MKTLEHEANHPRGYRAMADVIAHRPHFLERIYNNNRHDSALNYLSQNALKSEHAFSHFGQISVP